MTEHVFDSGMDLAHILVSGTAAGWDLFQRSGRLFD